MKKVLVAGLLGVAFSATSFATVAHPPRVKPAHVHRGQSAPGQTVNGGPSTVPHPINSLKQNRRPQAFGFPAVGLKVSNVVTDLNTLQATFDVSEWMPTQYPFPTAWLGVAASYAVNVYPAIDYGDGSTLVANPVSGRVTGISFVSNNTFPTENGGTRSASLFRGSFVHTYPASANYTITSYSTCCNDFPAYSGAGIITGYKFSFVYGLGSYHDLSATAGANFGPGVPALAIPTASRTGLILLGLALAAGGVWALRRS